MKPATRLIAVSIALVSMMAPPVWWPVQAQAQSTNLIPKSEAQRKLEERDRERHLGIATDLALQAPSTIIEKSPELAERLGEKGMISSKAAGGIAFGFGAVVEATKVGAAFANGSDAGKIQAAQSSMKLGLDSVGFFLSPPVAAAWSGGTMLGGVLRESRFWMDTTVGDHVDEWYFSHTTDSVKEWVSGTKQVDFDSADYQNNLDMEFKRRRNAMSFARVQSENQEQARQAAQMQAAANESSYSAAEPASTSATPFMDVLNQTLLQANQQMMQANQLKIQRESQSATAAQCTIDPKTGCHTGHNEQSHPGGCKCGR